eukprot:15475819-Alexandrium_andersonii.AAC.1
MPRRFSQGCRLRRAGKRKTFETSVRKTLDFECVVQWLFACVPDALKIVLRLPPAARRKTFETAFKQHIRSLC